MPYQKVTFLEDLDNETPPPQIHTQSSNQSMNQDDRTKRFIRNGHVLNPSSGMMPTHAMPQQQSMPQSMPQSIQEFGVPNVTCQDVFFHIENCPVCSKMYKHDNTVYLVIIAILALFSALLLKKVLSV